MAVRGSLGILLGATVLLWPAVGLGGLVVLFGMYALLGGFAAAASAVRVSRPLLEGWPVLLEGVFSVSLGVSALAIPLEAALFARMTALWALVTSASACSDSGWAPPGFGVLICSSCGWRSVRRRCRSCR